MASWHETRPPSYLTDPDLARERNLDRWTDRGDVYNHDTRRFETDDPMAEAPSLRMRFVTCNGCGTERGANDPSCSCCGLTDWQAA